MLIQVTPPAALYTASAAKAAVPGLADATDTQVDAWLAAATTEVQNLLERAIGSQTWDWKPWGADSVPVWPLNWTTQTYPYPWPNEWRSWPPYLEIPLRPLISVTSFKYLDEDGNEQTWNSSNYRVSGVGDVGRITLVSGSNWPDLGDYPEPVTIRFVAGYATVPEPIKQAVLLKASDIQSGISGASGDVRSRSIEGLGSESYDVGSSSSRSSSGNNLTVERLLQPYRVFA